MVRVGYGRGSARVRSFTLAWISGMWPRPKVVAKVTGNSYGANNERNIGDATLGSCYRPRVVRRRLTFMYPEKEVECGSRDSQSSKLSYHLSLPLGVGLPQPYEVFDACSLICVYSRPVCSVHSVPFPSGVELGWTLGLCARAGGVDNRD